MASQWETAASVAGAFSKAGARTIFVSAVPIAAVGLVVGMAIWLTHNFIVVGSGR